MIEPVLVLNSKFPDTDQEQIPDYFWPKSGKWGIRGKSNRGSLYNISPLTLSADLHKTFIDDDHYNSGHGHAYETYGVDPDVGAIVIVRPDQCMYDTNPAVANADDR
jgi:phenol 2-monooxygenase